MSIITGMRLDTTRPKETTPGDKISETRNNYPPGVVSYVKYGTTNCVGNVALDGQHV